jgi:hypothetical protein
MKRIIITRFIFSVCLVRRTFSFSTVIVHNALGADAQRPGGLAQAGVSLPLGRAQNFQIRTNFRASHAPACAKPRVRRWHLSAKLFKFSDCFNFDVRVGIAPNRNINETLSRTNISSVILYIHIRFNYTTFSTNAARQKRLIYCSTRS